MRERKRRCREEGRRYRGASFVEYLIMVAFIGLAAIAAVRAFRVAVADTVDAEARSVLSLSDEGRRGATREAPSARDSVAAPGDTRDARPDHEDDSCHGFWGCAWDKVSHGPKQWWSYEKGLFGAAWDDISGTVVDTKDFVVTLFTDPKSLVTGAVDTVKYVAQHPLDTLKSLVWDDESSAAWQQGDYAQAIGRTAWNVGSYFIPGVGEVKAASRLGKLARIVHDAEKKLPGKHDGHSPAQQPPCEGNQCNGIDGPCFAAGTAVYTADGLRAIEAVQAGDRVWSRDEETGEVALRRVARTFVTRQQRVLRLVVDYGGGAQESMLVTPRHPFFTERGRLAAEQLRVNDEVLLLSGDHVVVRGVESSAERVTVYNFEVESFHTYFVGYGGLWVHNDCTDPPNDNGSDKPGQANPGDGASGDGDAKPSTPEPSLSSTIRWKGFAKGKLAEHYEKHGAEFGDITQREYLRLAMDFAAETGAGFRETRVGNIIVKYDPATRRVLIANANTRELRSFYKASDPFQEAIDTATKKTGQGNSDDGPSEGQGDASTAGN